MVTIFDEANQFLSWRWWILLCGFPVCMCIFLYFFFWYMRRAIYCTSSFSVFAFLGNRYADKILCNRVKPANVDIVLRSRGFKYEAYYWYASHQYFRMKLFSDYSLSLFISIIYVGYQRMWNILWIILIIHADTPLVASVVADITLLQCNAAVVFTNLAV